MGHKPNRFTKQRENTERTLKKHFNSFIFSVVRGACVFFPTGLFWSCFEDELTVFFLIKDKIPILGITSYGYMKCRT